MRHGIAAALALAFAASLPAAAAVRDGFELSVLVDGLPRLEMRRGPAVYVEALRGREYALRLTNPLDVRVGVALAVDGLNTVDASHGEAASAVKWILDPGESIVLEGWQVSRSHSRRFVFTGERESYGAAIGKTADLGVIEAVFFREKTRRPAPVAPRRFGSSKGEAAPSPSSSGPAAGAERSAAGAAPSPALSDEYAATGMGDRARHEVARVDVDLERTPAARIRIRYEFRPQLVKMGLLPPPDDRLARRERARGFDGFCPEPER